LAEAEDIEPCFIEFASEQKKYPWQTDREEMELDIETLIHAPYEQTSFRELYGKLVRVLEDFGPEAVVVPSYSPLIMLAAARWAKARGVASIMMNETTELDHPRLWWKEKIKSLLVQRYYDAAFVGGKATREYISKLGMSQELIWDRYDVIDNDYFSSRAVEVIDNKEEYRDKAELPEQYFLYVGRFSPEKNLPRLLKAYGQYRNLRHDGWSLVLAGDGPQREELLQIAQRLRLEDVVWPGFKQIDDLPIYYALGRAFILPSTSEPWGLVVNEAMASKLPVLVSNRCGSAWDLVYEGKNGYTFDPHDTEEMAECMRKLSDSSEADRYAMGDASREIIVGYSPKIWGENLADCIKQTVERVSRSTASPKWSD
jgi:glycosyltransferase involved in cell wall biosynthesis